jgi:sugar phosphate isomerase/epimerase
VPDRKFGVSTHLFHDRPLTRDDIVDVAAHHFDLIELFATRSHFDYRSPAAISELRDWLTDTHVELHSVHAPVMEAMRDGQWVGSFSIASGDEARRKAAVAEAEAALAIATTIPFQYLVVHVGVPKGQQPTSGDNQPDAARRSILEIAEAAATVHVRVALEVIPNALSGADVLVQMLEDQLEGVDVGVCLDYGHAHLMTDVAEAVESVSGHLWTTHVHDNHGRRDDHLVPYSGSINWDEAMMTTQKIGYDGVLLFEVGRGQGEPVDILKKLMKARERLEKTFVVF